MIRLVDVLKSWCAVEMSTSFNRSYHMRLVNLKVPKYTRAIVVIVHVYLHLFHA